MPNPTTQLNILLVENSEGDIVLIEKAFRHSSLTPHLYIVKDGEAALDFLYQRSPYEDTLPPDIILLDLNLPKINGVEVLIQVKSDSNLKTIPVIILSVSNSPYDILETYQHHANCYLTKPRDFADFMKLVQRIDDFWRTTVQLPPRI